MNPTYLGPIDNCGRKATLPVIMRIIEELPGEVHIAPSTGPGLLTSKIVAFLS